MRFKLTIVALTLFFLQCFAHVSAQINIIAKNEPLSRVFSMLHKQSGYGILFDPELIKKAGTVTLKLRNLKLDEALNLILKNKSLRYEIQGKTVVITADGRKLTQPAPGLVLQKELISISGMVKSTEGRPLIGVTVSVKGKAKGTFTDEEGKFNIDAEKGDIIEFSYVGYASKSILFKDQRALNVVLEVLDSHMEEIVTIGYGTQKKSDLTGAVTGIKSDEISKSKTLSFQEAMQGKLAGVQITSTSGEPGADVNVSIRGSNTIYGATSPLYVIDGMPYDVNTEEVAGASIGNGQASNPLASLNPSDIESIEVLKDASATAIYGSRGANGVVMITTKSGKAGKVKVDYEGQLGINSATKKMDVLSADEYIDFRRDVLPNSPLFYYDSNGDGIYNTLDQPRDPYLFPQHDWQKEMLRTSFSQNHFLSVSGGTKTTTFSGGLGYYDQNAIIKNNDYERYTMRLKVDHQQGRFKVGISMNTSYSELNGATQSGGNTAIFNGVVQNLVISRPLELFVPGWDIEGRYINPLSMINDAYKNTSLMRSTLNTYVNYKITNDLSLQVSLGGFLSSSKGKEFYKSNTDWGYVENGKAILQENRAYSWTNTDQLIYNKKLGRASQLNAIVAFERSKYNYERFFVMNSNFADESTGINDISKGATVQTISSARDGNNRLSWLGRVNYTYLNKHLLTATFRADGSDRFGPGNRFAYFPSFAYAWKVSRERFMQNQNLFSDLKLRLSYGQTGNERIPSYSYLDAMGNYFYNGELGLAPNSQYNPNLKWETTIQYNAGIDVGLLKNRITASVDYYTKQTRDMLLPAYVPSTSGYLRQWKNFGRVDNSGIEIQITSQNVKTKNFDWQTNFNISSNKNVVRNMGNVDFIPVIIGGGWIPEAGRVIVGQAIGNAYGYIFDGVYQISDFSWQNNSDPSIAFADRQFVLNPGVVSVSGINVKPGSFKFKDLNGDNVIDLDHDRTAISRSLPKFFGGITNTFRYKNFDLSFLLDWSYGNQIFNESKYRLEGGVLSTYMNITKEFWYNHWTPDNPTNEYGTYADRNQTALAASSYYVEDASWLRLRNIGIGYQLPSSIFKGKGIQGIRVYVTGTNLYTWTKYSGFDPEMSSGQVLLPGYDRISYPRTKTIMVGVNVSL